MVLKLSPKKTTTCLTNRKAPLRIFGSQFVWDLAAGDIILVIPPTGKYFYISTTSLNSITRIICKIGGPNGISALSNRISKEVRTYTITIERRFLYPENKIINTRYSDYRKRTTWTEEEWIRFFQGTGRSQGSYKLFITVWFRKLKSLKLAQKKYWELLEEAGLYKRQPPKI